MYLHVAVGIGERKQLVKNLASLLRDIAPSCLEVLHCAIVKGSQNSEDGEEVVECLAVHCRLSKSRIAPYGHE